MDRLKAAAICCQPQHFFSADVIRGSGKFIDLPDLEHIERAIPRLQPGATETRNYLIPDAEKWLGKYVRIGLEDPNGTRRMNYQIEIN